MSEPQSRAPGAVNATQDDHTDDAIAKALNASATLRKILDRLDLIGRDATGEIVTSSMYISDCPLCHKRITGPQDDDGPRFPALPRLGHTDDCPVTLTRQLLHRS